MDEFIAVIKLFAGNFAPQGWMFCHGQTLAINSNTALFSLLGTTYGGNGQTTFCLPDLRSRVPVGFGQGPGLSTVNLGQTGGAESASVKSTVQVVLKDVNLPAHTHPIQGDVKVAVADQIGFTSGSPNNVLAKQAIDKHVTPNTNIEMYMPAATATFKDKNKLGAVSHNLTTSPIGAGEPVSIPINVNIPVIQPFVGLNYIICVQGIYPSRS